MKNVNRFYLALIIGGAVAAIIALVSLYRTGSAAVPGWRTAFQPGALSSSHAFLNGKCESCHTPARGVEAAACVKCHTSAAADLAKQPTAFHATVQDCRGCHGEHEGGERPIKMDHAALERIGSHVAAGAAGHAGVTRQMRADLADFLGAAPAPTEQSSLDCASCHSNQDPHRELLGADCAGCHQTATWRIASSRHPSPTSKNCAQCHQAPPSHYSEHFSMGGMEAGGHGGTQISQCYQCHKTNSFRDRKVIGGGMH